MAEPELTFQELTRRLRLGELPVVEPSSDLWQRIAGAQEGCVRRRGRRRRGVIGSGIVAATLAGLLIIPAWFARPAADVDWQARAQALELQLRALQPATHEEDAAALESQTEIVRIDYALQNAYDTGAEKNQLAQLWKRRSELLGTLISVRQQHVAISRI